MDVHSCSTIKITSSSPETYAEDREAGKRNVPANGASGRFLSHFHATRLTCLGGSAGSGHQHSQPDPAASAELQHPHGWHWDQHGSRGWTQPRQARVKGNDGQFSMA